MTNKKTWEEQFDEKVLKQFNGGEPYFPDWEAVKQFITTLLSELKEEVIDKINERKEEVRKVEGAFKYDWCFEDCIKIIKKHNN